MKAFLSRFFKSIFVGMGGVSPGLSGSVMMIILGLYRKTIDAIASIFKDFKRKFIFLLPIVLGMACGMLIFSNIIDFFLGSFEMQTRFMFFGLIMGTLPLFYKEVKSNGYEKHHYLFILAGFAVGFVLFILNGEWFPQIQNPTFIEKIMIGFAVIASSIVPGVDAAVILSSFGLYEIYVSSVASLDFSVLLPMVIGVGIGALTVSFIISWLCRHFYTATFSTLFGLFLAMIPSIFTENCKMALDLRTAISLVLMVIGFLISLYMGNAEKNFAKLKGFFSKSKNDETEKQ